MSTRSKFSRALVLLAAGSLLAVTGCASTNKVEPQTKTFAFSAKELDVLTNDNPTDLAVSKDAPDTKEVRVTLWFDKGITVGGSDIKWELKGSTLDLDASCNGVADCDTKFRVEVPRDVKVKRNGKATDIKG